MGLFGYNAVYCILGLFPMKNRLVSTLIVTSFLLSTSMVRAVDVPSFPSCPNPGGSLKVSYSSGVHGIAGRSETFEGQDSVYIITDTNTVQCYCAPNGSGIQTNWWKVSSLTAEQKAELITAGWIYIPDGSAWGLDPSDWMAKNVDVSCGEKGGGSSSSSSSSSSSGSSSSGSSIASIIPTILGFADTGRQLFLRNLTLGLGIVFSLFGTTLFLMSQGKSQTLPTQKKTKPSKK